MFHSNHNAHAKYIRNAPHPLPVLIPIKIAVQGKRPATASLLFLPGIITKANPLSLPPRLCLGKRVNRNEAHKTVTVHRQSVRRAATTAAA